MVLLQDIQQGAKKHQTAAHVDTEGAYQDAAGSRSSQSRHPRVAPKERVLGRRDTVRQASGFMG